MILGGDGIIWGEGILGGDLIWMWDWFVVLGGSWYLWVGVLEVNRVVGLLRGGGRGCGVVIGGFEILIFWDRIIFFCLV